MVMPSRSSRGAAGLPLVDALVGVGPMVSQREFGRSSGISSPSRPLASQPATVVEQMIVLAQVRPVVQPNP